MTKTLDLLAFGAHPDDVDACCGGTLISSVREGKQVGVIDLTTGDNSQTGNGQIRLKESQASAKIMGLSFRENLFLQERNLITVETEDLLAEKIRFYRPEIVICPYWEDRHRTHRDASYVLERAIQTAKYTKLSKKLPPHKVKTIIYYMIHYEFSPNFIFDISSFQTQKIAALYCHKSQLFQKSKSGGYSKELIDPDFMEAWIARSRWYGYISGFKYGEAFAMKRPVGINTLSSLLNRYR